MRGLEGVWKGASRHQSLIIYRPHFFLPSHPCGKDGRKKQCGEHTCSYHHIRVMMSGGDEEWRDEKCGSEEAWNKV